MPNTSTAGPSSTMSWRCLWTASSSSSTNNTELEHRPYKPLSINLIGTLIYTIIMFAAVWQI